MFILEESQLLEDTIKDKLVLGLYKSLQNSEPSNDRTLYISDILSNEKCLSLTNLLIDFYETNGFSICEQVDDKSRFSVEQRNEICSKLGLDNNDTAALTLVLSAAMTQLFVIDNFLGPSNESIVKDFYRDLPEVYQDLKDKITHKSLTKDGSEIYHKTVNPWLLRLTQLYWNFLNNLGCSRRLIELEFLVWKHRYLSIYLMILLETNESITNELRKVQEHIFDHHILASDSKENNTQLVRFNIVDLCCELVQSCLLRGSMTASRKIFDYACEIAGITIEHTGILGKRTKFQHKDIPQLVVKISKKDPTKCIPTKIAVLESNLQDEYKTDLPKDITLDDDTLLPDIAFVTNEDGESCGDKSESTITLDELNFDSQLLMITKLDIMLRSEVMEESLKDEWTLAYLRSIIKFSSTWSIRFKGLAMRSIVERKHMRKMDRALMQMEELIKAVDNSTDRSNKRAKSFYSVLFQSNWQMQRSLGDISFDLALFKNALEMYTKIEYWEGIIRCYCGLGQTVKAEKIIRQELDKQETPYLYCLLGDATDDINYYEKSWTLSNNRFARAKKSIGTYYYTRKKYSEAIDNYEQALSVNPSNISILSLLAYSCLNLERYERAAECYRNITYHDDGNFLAWNNLSKAYIKLNQKERAWRTLREAIKCNYEEWKIWENFMIVSIEIGALDDVITAWHRIIDIKSSHKDDQILGKLTYLLVRRPNNKVNQEYMKILNDALKLVARLNSTSDCSPKLWLCYYKLLIKEFELLNTLGPNETGNTQPMTKLDIASKVSKITNALQRSTPTTLMAEADWFRVPDKVDRLLDCYDELVDCYIYALEVLGPRPELWRQWKNFKLSVTNVMKTLQLKGYSKE